MKKFFSFAVLIVIPFLFFGCSSKDLMLEASENADYYQIVASLDEDAHTLQANEEITMKNRTNSELCCLKFHLHPNAFSKDAKKNCAVSSFQESKAYDGQKSFGGIEILSVSIDDLAANFVIEGEDKHILSVDLQSFMKPNQSLKIDINFVLTIPKVNHRFGYGNSTLNLGNWYPVLCVFENGEWDTQGYLPVGDPFYSKISNYEVTLSYNKNLSLASTGSLIEEKIENETKISTYKALAVRDFAMVLSNNFSILEQDVSNTKIKYYFYDDENAEMHLKTCVDAINTFNELFGEYPYETLCVVKSNFLHGGMEYPNLVYVSDQIQNEAEYNNVIVHEIAHQWWYGLVGNNELSYGFIDEGLAEYSTALFYDKNTGYEYKKSEVIGNALSSYLLFCDVYKEAYNNLNTAMNRNVSTFNTETEYVYLTYVKGLLMFDSIADTIGEKKMIKCLKGIVLDYSFKEITPNELIACFEKYSKRKLQSFITSWLDGTVVLEELNG